MYLKCTQARELRTEAMLPLLWHGGEKNVLLVLLVSQHHMTVRDCGMVTGRPVSWSLPLNIHIPERLTEGKAIRCDTACEWESVLRFGLRCRL